MSDAARWGYQYVVLRCVPRAEREEFVNVGVVLFCQALDFLGSASHLDEDRLATLAPALDLSATVAALDAVQEVCEAGPASGAVAGASLGVRFGYLAAPRSTVIRPGPVHGGVTDDPVRQLDSLLDALVRS
jgi:hypothetical protein